MGFIRLWAVGPGILGRLRVGHGRDGGYQQGPVIGDVVDVFAHAGVESDGMPDISGFKLQDPSLSLQGPEANQRCSFGCYDI